MTIEELVKDENQSAEAKISKLKEYLENGKDGLLRHYDLETSMLTTFWDVQDVLDINDTLSHDECLECLEQLHERYEAANDWHILAEIVDEIVGD